MQTINVQNYDYQVNDQVIELLKQKPKHKFRLQNQTNSTSTIKKVNKPTLSAEEKKLIIKQINKAIKGLLIPVKPKTPVFNLVKTWLKDDDWKALISQNLENHSSATISRLYWHALIEANYHNTDFCYLNPHYVNTKQRIKLNLTNEQLKDMYTKLTREITLLHDFYYQLIEIKLPGKHYVITLLNLDYFLKQFGIPFT